MADEIVVKCNDKNSVCYCQNGLKGTIVKYESFRDFPYKVKFRNGSWAWMLGKYLRKV